MVVSNRCRSVFVCVAIACLVAIPAAAAPRIATLSVGGASLDWAPQGSFESMKLSVSGPSGLVSEQTFAAGQQPSFGIFDKAGQRLADGVYNWELRGTPQINASVKRQLNQARRSGDQAAIERLREQGLLPAGGVMSGTFVIANGSFVADEGQTEQAPRATAAARITAADQVIPDDLIVQGSGCFGFDCVNNESFGFDTIRLKENNLRIKFEDTSVGTFPTNDWQLTANDSASGGSSKFSIEDITGSRVPFTITAGAATNSIFVDSTGRLGLRTSTPVLDLHINTSNTPSIRLEQNNSGGFTAQTWDIGANEANFFVRDVTGGSKLSLRIRPGAPTSSLDISSDGDVGIGTGSPDDQLHVLTSDAGTTGIGVHIENTNGTTAAREMLVLENAGGTVMIFDDSTIGERWSNGTNSTSFVVNNQNNAGIEYTFGNTGNLTAAGSMNATAFNLTSDRNLKEAIVPVQANDVLARVAAMPISTWKFKNDDVRHMGPMAQDFAAAFGLGADDTRISVTDIAGVSLAAIQALHQQASAKDAEIADLKQRLAALEALIATVAVKP